MPLSDLDNDQLMEHFYQSFVLVFGHSPTPDFKYLLPLITKSFKTGLFEGLVSIFLASHSILTNKLNLNGQRHLKIISIPEASWFKDIVSKIQDVSVNDPIS